MDSIVETVTHKKLWIPVKIVSQNVVLTINSIKDMKNVDLGDYI